MRKVNYNKVKNQIIIDIRDKIDYDLFHLDNSINYPLHFLEENYKVLLDKKQSTTFFAMLANPVILCQKN